MNLASCGDHLRQHIWPSQVSQVEVIKAFALFQLKLQTKLARNLHLDSKPLSSRLKQKFYRTIEGSQAGGERKAPIAVLESYSPFNYHRIATSAKLSKL
jgi:hypothetical protein